MVSPTDVPKRVLSPQNAADILATLTPVSLHSSALKTLSQRGLEGESLPISALGVAPTRSVLEQLGLPYWIVNQITGKMLTPLYNFEGTVIAFRARRCDGKMIRLSGGRETKSMGIGPSSCTVMATTGGLALLRGEPPLDNLSIIIGEGEGDLWLRQMLTPNAVYWGSVSGSSCQEIAEKIPSNYSVILRHHLDSAGNVMAEKWGRLLKNKTNLWRLRSDVSHLDDGDRWQKGILHPTDFFEHCTRYRLQPLPNLDAEYNARRIAILNSSQRFPSSHRSSQMLARYRGCLNSIIHGMEGHLKGGRAIAIYNYSRMVAGLCTAAENEIDRGDSLDLSIEYRQCLEAAAIRMMGSERKEALAQVKSGWKSGISSPCPLSDDRIEPCEINRLIKTSASRKKETRGLRGLDSKAQNEFVDIGMSLKDMRVALDKAIQVGVETPGVKIVIAPCGAGKSRAVKKTIIKRLKGKRGTLRSIISVPTKDLEAEMAGGFQTESNVQEAGLHIQEAITRSPENCINFQTIKIANSTIAAGGSLFCRKTCPLGWGQWKSKNGEETPCEWAKTNKSFEDSDILVNTHSLETKRNGIRLRENRKVSIDWRSFEHTAKQGIPAIPIVFRGNSLSIRATAAEKGKGKSVPTADLVSKINLTEQSQRDVLAWILNYYKQETPKGLEKNKTALKKLINTLARKITGAAEDVHVFVRWSTIVNIRVGVGHFPSAVPTMEIVEEGWPSGVHVSIQLQDNGVPLPKIETYRRMTRSKNSKQDIVRWIADAWGVADNRNALQEAAASRVALYPIDVTVFDESVWQQVLKSGEATIEQLSRCISTGEIADGDSPATSTLLRLMHKCQSQGKEIYSAEILSLIPTETISVDPGRTARDVLTGLKPSQTSEDHIKALKDLVHWVVPEGLNRALQNSWQGIMISKRGTLVTSWVKPIDTDHSRSTINLDATATSEIARACFSGQNVEIVKFNLKRPAHMHIKWVIMDTSSSAGCFSGRSRKALGEMIAAQLEFGGKDSLVISHKKHVIAEEGIFSLIKKDGSSLLHHNKTLARGSNKFEDLSAVIIHDYYAPRSAVIIQAEALAIALGQDIKNPDVKNRLEKEVRHQLEVAPVRQALQRIRANLATTQKSKTLVFLSTTSPARFGYMPDEVIDPEILTRKYLGRSSVRSRGMILSDIFDRIDGGYMPTIAVTQLADFKLGDLIPDATKKEACSLVKILGADLLNDIKEDWGRNASHRLMTWNQRIFKGSWVSFVKNTEISVVMIETSAGGNATPYLYQGVLDRNDIAKWLSSREMIWWRVKGEKETTMVEGTTGILGIMRTLTKDEINTSTIGTLLSHVADHLGFKTGRAARTRMNRYCLEGESLRDCFVRLWISAHMQQNQKAVESLVSDYGDSLLEAVAGAGAAADEIPMPWDLKEIIVSMSEESLIDDVDLSSC